MPKHTPLQEINRRVKAIETSSSMLQAAIKLDMNPSTLSQWVSRVKHERAPVMKAYKKLLQNKADLATAVDKMIEDNPDAFGEEE